MVIYTKNTIDNYFSHVYLPWVMGDEQTKRLIEDKYNGVHEWKPEVRGACRTSRFTGEHPDIIDLEKLQSKFEKQLVRYV